MYLKIQWNWGNNNGSINEDLNISKPSKSKNIGGIAVVIQNINWLNECCQGYINLNYKDFYLKYTLDYFLNEIQ